jgi:hypothetical protein
MFDHVLQADPGLEVEMLRDLEATRPVLIIDSARYEERTGDDYPAPLIRKLIADHYDYIGKLWYADVYRLR